MYVKRKTLTFTCSLCKNQSNKKDLKPPPTATMSNLQFFFFDSLEEAINTQFPDRVLMEPIMDIGVTGNFEITAMQSGGDQLLHSKSTLGMGKCESEEERGRLFTYIKMYLNQIDKKKTKEADTI